MLRARHPLRVAVLASHRAPGIRDLLADPVRGTLYELSGVLAAEEDFRDAAAIEAAGVPVVIHSLRRFCARGHTRLADLAARRDYDRQTADVLEVFQPDLILLSGYLLILTRPMLAAYPNRIVNIHGSDLTVSTASGEPRYLGLQAVERAIFAGERETRATAHFVTPAVDLGLPILRSRAFPVSPLAEAARSRGDVRMLKAYAFAHQEWMLHEAWGPLWKSVVRLAAAGRIPLGKSTAGARPPLRSLSDRGALLESNLSIPRPFPAAQGLAP
jgi:folate-dependent phosphoribosylglycinamide formyltransferase PurN